MHLVLRKIIEEHNHIINKVSFIFLAHIIHCEWPFNPSLVGRTMSFTYMFNAIFKEKVIISVLKLGAV